MKKNEKRGKTFYHYKKIEITVVIYIMIGFIDTILQESSR